MGEDDRKEMPLQSAVQTRSPSEPPPELAALFRQHHERVYHAAYRVTGDPQDAEDAMQNVFLRLLSSDRGRRLSSTPGSYLYRAAVNAGLDLLRRRRRAPAVELADAADAVPDDGSPDPEDRRRGRELAAALRAALTTLTPGAAEIFALRYFEGHANKEIADMLGMSQTAVAVSLHRARARLRDELGTHLGGI